MGFVLKGKMVGALPEQGPGNSKGRHGMVTFGRLFLSLSDDEEHEWITRTCRKAEDGAPGQKPGP